MFQNAVLDELNSLSKVIAAKKKQTSRKPKHQGGKENSMCNVERGSRDDQIKFTQVFNEFKGRFLKAVPRQSPQKKQRVLSNDDALSHRQLRHTCQSPEVLSFATTHRLNRF